MLWFGSIVCCFRLHCCASLHRSPGNNADFSASLYVSGSIIALMFTRSWHMVSLLLGSNVNPFLRYTTQVVRETAFFLFGSIQGASSGYNDAIFCIVLECSIFTFGYYCGFFRLHQYTKLHKLLPCSACTSGLHCRYFRQYCVQMLECYGVLSFLFKSPL